MTAEAKEQDVLCSDIMEKTARELQGQTVTPSQ